jgi:hypothetical protein
LSIFPNRNFIALNKGGPMFKMAAHHDQLPDRVGITSFGLSFTLPSFMANYF